MAVAVDVIGVVGTLVVSMVTEDVKGGSPADCLFTFKAEKAVDVEVGLGGGVVGGVGVPRSELTSDSESEGLA